MTPGSGFLLIYIDNQSIGKDVWFDNLLVTQYSSDVLEEDHYYPFGLTMNINATNVQAQKNPYKLTTKELESKFDLNMYDFGARMQDMQLGRWWQVDPLAEKYLNMSPYNYCGNNPAIFSDLDGEDYGVHFSDNSVTISATFYTNSVSACSANQSAERLNQQSGNYTYTVGKGENAKTYTVVFDIKVVEVAEDGSYWSMRAVNEAIGNDKSGEANIYLVVPQKVCSLRPS